MWLPEVVPLTAALAALTFGLGACGGLVDASPTGAVRDAATLARPDGYVRVDARRDSATLNDGGAADALEAASSDAIADETVSDVNPPLGVLPSSAMCLTGGNVLWIEGGPDNFWFTGMQLDTGSSVWTAEAVIDSSPPSVPYDNALLEVTPPGVQPGVRWYFNFNSWNAGAPLVAGATYGSGQFYGGSSVAYMATCAEVNGSFRLDAFTAASPDGGSGAVTDFTAAFSFQCAGTTGVLSGCIHYSSE